MSSAPRSRSGRRMATMAAAAMIVALGLAACSAPASKTAVTNYKGEPKGVDAPSSSAGGAPWGAWLQNGSQFSVTLYGSSTCPPIGEKYAITGKQQVKITLKPYAKNKICTFDYVPHTTVFQTASAIDTSLAVRITAQQTAFTLEGKK